MKLLVAAVVLLCGSAIGQTKPVPTKPSIPSISGGGVTTTGFAAVSEPPDLSVANTTVGGVHTITISDPRNHWRCVVTSTVPANPGNPLHTEMSAFTMTCFDATDLEPVAKSENKQK